MNLFETPSQAETKYADISFAQFQFNSFRKSLLATFWVVTPLVSCYTIYFLFQRPDSYAENLCRILASICIFTMAIYLSRKTLHTNSQLTITLLGILSYAFLAYPAVSALGAERAAAHLIAMSAIFSIAFISLVALSSRLLVCSVILLFSLAPFLPAWYLIGWEAIRPSLVLRMLSFAFLSMGLALMLKQETTANYHLNMRLKFNSNHDSLSGLLNRRGFHEKLSALFETRETAKTPETLAILMIDVDHFKTINDKHGHDIGDRVIQQLASTLQQCLSSKDLSSRYGGEEFIVAMLRNEASSIQQDAEMLRQQIENLHVHFGSTTLRYTVSIGVAFKEPQESWQQLILRADHCLYRAKESGRNQVICHSPNHQALA